MNLNYNKVKLHTLGCKVNQYETEAISEIFEESGYEVVEEEFADIYVINTCTVTSLSDSKSRQMIRKFKRINPQSTVVVMGCYSQVADKDVEKIESVDVIIGTTERNEIVNLVEEFQTTGQRINIVRDITGDNTFQPIDITNLRDMTRAYLKVQDGCNRFCSYCIIPYARGNIRSRDPEDVRAEVIKLSENGYQEVILTGIHIASYGKDKDNLNLINLIESIHDVEGISRIRLSSVEPRLITEEFLISLKNFPKFCDHFHLSLQSGSNTVLKRMNRKYTREEYLEKVELIRKFYPNAGITTDIIVGFPGETEDEFQETLDLVKKVKFSRVHIFKYSKRKGTPAAEMTDQVHGDIKNERSKILFELTNRLKDEFESSFIGRALSVLVERKIEDNYYGHTSNYMEITFNSARDCINDIVEVEMTEYKDDKLFGKMKGEYHE